MSIRILIIGDSQVESALKTYGFATILNDRFNGEADVILRFDCTLRLSQLNFKMIKILAVLVEVVLWFGLFILTSKSIKNLLHQNVRPGSSPATRQSG